MSFRDERPSNEAIPTNIPPPDFTHEAIAAQTAAFLARGRQIEQVPNGAVSPLTNHSLHAQTAREAKAALGER